MVLYKPIAADGFEWLNCDDPQDYELFAEFRGENCISQWPIPSVLRVPAEENSLALKSNFPWLGSDALVFDDEAASFLRHLLVDNGVLLPLNPLDGGRLFVFDAQLVDALVESESKITKFPDSGRIMVVESEMLDETKLEGMNVFRLPYRSSPTYVSDQFVSAVNQHGLVGLDFECVKSTSVESETL